MQKRKDFDSKEQEVKNFFQNFEKQVYITIQNEVLKEEKTQLKKDWDSIQSAQLKSAARLQEV